MNTPTFESTSAAGPMLMRPGRAPVVMVGFMLAGLSTSGLHAAPTNSFLAPPMEQTTAGAPIAIADHAGASIAELRRLSGLTWDQLARLFDVSRRSLHFWASGKAMTPTNEEHLQRLLAAVRKIDTGSASRNRAALLPRKSSEGQGRGRRPRLAAGTIFEIDTRRPKTRPRKARISLRDNAGAWWLMRTGDVVVLRLTPCTRGPRGPSFPEQQWTSVPRPTRATT